MMRKFKLITLAFIGIVFLFCTGFGLYTSSQWEDDTNWNESLSAHDYTMLYIFSVDYDTENISFYTAQEVNSFDTLFSTADLVVRVQVCEDLERTMYKECVLTNAEVLDVYKGEVSDQVIPIFEPSYIYDDYFLVTNGSYHPMENGAQYILFLKRIPCGLYGNNDYVYLPTTASLSKYQCKDDKCIGEVFVKKDDLSEYVYSEVCDYDIATSSQRIKIYYERNAEAITELLIEGKDEE